MFSNTWIEKNQFFRSRLPFRSMKLPSSFVVAGSHEPAALHDSAIFFFVVSSSPEQVFALGQVMTSPSIFEVTVVQDEPLESVRSNVYPDASTVEQLAA